MPCAVVLVDLILVDDLEAVVVDTPLVDQGDVLCAAVVPLQHLHIVLLNLPGLLHDMLRWVGDGVLEEPLPLCIREVVVVQLLQLLPKVGNQIGLGVNRKIGVTLFPQQADKFFFQCSLALIAVGTCSDWLIFRHHCIFAGGSNQIISAHY